MAEMDRAVAAEETDGFIKLVAGPRPVLRTLGGGRILGATIVGSRRRNDPRTGTGDGHPDVRRTASAATHAYPTWSYGVQLAAAQFFMTIGGRTAHPARRMPKRPPGSLLPPCAVVCASSPNRPAMRPTVTDEDHAIGGLMTTASTAHGAIATLSSRLVAGVAGGLVGGVTFGILMPMMDMMPMVAGW